MSTNITISVRENCLLRECGSGNQDILILVAGFGDNGTMFLPLFQTELQQKYRLIAIDLPGTGGSPANSAITRIEDFGKLVGKIARGLTSNPVGLIGHSIASAICVAAAQKTDVAGLFSIEGNLTRKDAYFTGRAAQYSNHDDFWTAQRMDIKAMQTDDPVLRRYFAAATFADPRTMWLLGLDAVKSSEGDGLGQNYLRTGCPAHYFWSPDNTPAETVAFIRDNGIENSSNSGSHWPTIDRTAETAAAIDAFFRQCF